MPGGTFIKAKQPIFHALLQLKEHKDEATEVCHVCLLFYKIKKFDETLGLSDMDVHGICIVVMLYTLFLILPQNLMFFDMKVLKKASVRNSKSAQLNSHLADGRESIPQVCSLCSLL